MEKTAAVPSANARVAQIEIRQAAVVRKFLGMFENVANTANRMNQRSGRVVIYLAAETINVNVDHIGCGVNPHFPDMVQNHGSGHNPPFIAAKIFQQRKLLRGQLQQVLAPPRLTTYQVKLQVRRLQTHRFGLRDRGPA